MSTSWRIEFQVIAQIKDELKAAFDFDPIKFIDKSMLVNSIKDNLQFHNNLFANKQ